MHLIKINSEGTTFAYISAEDISSFELIGNFTVIHMRNKNTYKVPGDITATLAKTIITVTDGKTIAL